MTQFDVWRSDLAKIAANSPNPIVRHIPPRLVFAKMPLGAHTGFFTITISDDLVMCVCSQTIRRYLLAHELGHFGWAHSYITVFGGMCIATLLFTIPPNWLPLNYLTAGIGLLGFVITYFYSQTYIFEKAADRAGARMIGAAAMKAGIADITALRINKNIEVDAESYARKVAWLDGKKASIWR